MADNNINNTNTKREIKPKFDLDSFANGLEELWKYYKNDKDKDKDKEVIVEYLRQYCAVIRSGYARSRTNEYGHSIDNEWVISSFCKIFDPLLIRLFPQHSLGWVEFVIAEIQLPLSNHLSKDTLKTIANKLNLIALNIETYATNFDQISKQYIEEASTVGLLANILSYLHKFAPKSILSWCNCCWRRAHETSNYCLLHKPKSVGSNNNNKMGKKIYKEISQEFDLENELNKVRSLRMAFRENVKIISYEDDVSAQSLSNTFYIRTDQLTKKLIDSTLNTNWNSGVSILWDKELKNEFPNIYSILNSKPSSFSSWNDFINSVRYVLNEDVEKCSHPYWFLYELSIAERWTRFERHSTNPHKIRDIVLALSNSGIDKKEISLKVGLKKSRIYQIIKKT